MEISEEDRRLFTLSLNTAPLKKHHVKPTNKLIAQLYYGPHLILRPWYSAPFPAEYHRPDGLLWMCNKCLRYFGQQIRLARHVSKCKVIMGEEVYRDSKLMVSVMQVDGAREKPFCVSLCLLAKLFLDHKTLYYDTEPFQFYVLYEHEKQDSGLVSSSIVGYFSKEKQSPSGYNLSCILVMPHRQRHGYGSLLIDLSFKLLGGTPEKPLSDLGLLAYTKYWLYIVKQHKGILVKRPNQDGVKELSVRTGMSRNDVMACLEHLGAVWRTTDGHILLKPDLIPSEEGRIRLVDPDCLLN